MSEFMERAQAMLPRLRERVPRADAERKVPVETVEEFADAGFFRMLQPSRYGGLERTPSEFFDVLVEIASACPSSAWILGVIGVHNWQLALFPGEAQEDVWGERTDVRISSSYMPVGKVKLVDGGYRLSGTWGFSSGCDHTEWAFLGAFAPRAGRDETEMLTFLVPSADYTIVDDWFVAGLKGTGSKSIHVDDVFVPAHRTHRVMDGFRCQSPGNEVNTAPLFRLPFGQIFTRTVATPAVGMLKGALEAFLAANRGRVGRSDGKSVLDDPATQEACARALVAIGEVKALERADFGAMMAKAERGETIPIEDRLAYRCHSGEVTDRMTRALDELFLASGGGAIFLESGIQRFFQDVHAARAHHANNPRKTARSYGSVLLGRDPSDFFV